MRRKNKIQRNAPFKKIGGAKPRRSAHNLSYSNVFTCDMGQLIPVCCLDAITGDTFRIGNTAVLRFQPLVKPTMHEINIYTHYFFVPYRLLDDDFEDFLTMGITGDFEGTLEPWNSTGTYFVPQKYTIWDYLGFGGIGLQIPNEDMPNAFPKLAYNFIFNEFMRDQNFIQPVELDQNNILNCAWEKDYFTSAQPRQQRGTSPSFPIGGVADLRAYNNYPPKNTDTYPTNTGQPLWNLNVVASIFNGSSPSINNYNNSGGSVKYLGANMENATLFNMNDLRVAMQIQLWMERNQRGGARFTEFLLAHFGVSPKDERLDRPEYIGGSKSPCIISEVLQTSANENDVSPQGNLAGHGISANANFIGTYNVKEPGLIMGIMSVRPRTVYSQGIPRTWLKKTPFDFVFPEFAHLSEQGIYNKELNITASTEYNNQIQGFIPRYDEYRYSRNIIAADMRDYFEDWHLARKLPANTQLNSDFITMNPSKRIFAVQNEPGLVVNFGNQIIAYRPIPIMGEPGLIDHTYA